MFCRGLIGLTDGYNQMQWPNLPLFHDLMTVAYLTIYVLAH